MVWARNTKKNNIKTENYSVAWKLHDDMIQLKVKDAEFVGYFEWAASCDYEPAFIQENERKVRIPDIRDAASLKELAGIPHEKHIISPSAIEPIQTLKISASNTG